MAVLETARRHGASNVRVFGSVARGEDGPESDVDLVVDLASGTGLVGLATLERELSSVLGAAVDLAPSDSLRPAVRDAIESEAIPL
jgi:predicted nucleotidyltransferase